MGNNKNKIAKKFKEQVNPFLDGFTDRLLRELEKEKIILKMKSQDPNIYYQLNFNQTIEQSSKNVAPKDIFKELFEFRNIVRSVYWNLKLADSDSSRDYTLTQVISKLHERKAFSAPWVKNKNVVFVIDKLDSLVGDDIKIRKEIEKTIKDNKIDTNVLTLQLLEYYGVERAKNYFSDFEYTANEKSETVDLLMTHSKSVYPKLIFEFKYRKKSPLPSRDIILRSLKQIEELSKSNEGISQYFLVIFTQQELGSFEKIRLQYIKELREVKKYEEYKERIRFVPIGVNYLHLIEEEFKNFKETYIQQDIRYRFITQTPPKNHPDRNDHFLERTFEFKKSDFQITITPGSTKFWRFGFKFSPSEKFPDITDGRHPENDNADIHITVGDLETKDGVFNWIKPNQLGLAVYHAEVIGGEFTGINNYEGNPVQLSVKSNNDGSNAEFALQINDVIIGKKIFNLSKFNFCKIHAWCDYGQFDLNTEIKVVHK